MEGLLETLEYQTDAGTLLTATRGALEDRQAVLRDQVSSTVRNALDQGAPTVVVFRVWPEQSPRLQRWGAVSIV
jgi:hypothetical protein